MAMTAQFGLDSAVLNLRQRVKEKKDLISSASWTVANKYLCDIISMQAKSVGGCDTTPGTAAIDALKASLKAPLGVRAEINAALALFDTMATDVHNATGAGERDAVDAVVTAARAAIVAALG